MGLTRDVNNLEHVAKLKVFQHIRNTVDFDFLPSLFQKGKFDFFLALLQYQQFISEHQDICAVKIVVVSSFSCFSYFS